MSDAPTHAIDRTELLCRDCAGETRCGRGDTADAVGDRSWAERFAAGEPEIVQAVVEEYQPRIARLVQRLLAWPSDVADVVQDVFVAALEARRKFRGDSRLETWLVRIAINQCRAHNRRRWVRGKLFAAWGAQYERRFPEADALTTTVEGRGPDPPDVEAADQERASLVRHAVGKLPQKYREVIVLYYLEGWTAAEVAEALELRTNSVEVRLSRARKRLAEALAHLEGEIS